MQEEYKNLLQSTDRIIKEFIQENFSKEEFENIKLTIAKEALSKIENLEDPIEIRKEKLYVRCYEREIYKKELKNYFAKIMLGKVVHEGWTLPDALDDYVENYLKTYKESGLYPVKGELRELQTIMIEKMELLIQKVEDLLKKDKLQ